MDWHVHYKNGILPVGGGLLDQSAYFLEAMEEIERWVTANVAESARSSKA